MWSQVMAPPHIPMALRCTPRRTGIRPLYTGNWWPNHEPDRCVGCSLEHTEGQDRCLCIVGEQHCNICIPCDVYYCKKCTDRMGGAKIRACPGWDIHHLGRSSVSVNTAWEARRSLFARLQNADVRDSRDMVVVIGFSNDDALRAAGLWDTVYNRKSRATWTQARA